MNAKRIFDLLLAIIALIPVVAISFVVAIIIKATSPGPVLHRSKRVGRGVDNYFSMLKFRTMITDAPQVATHLLNDPEKYVTGVGHFLRGTSLDELPQLWNVFTGEMSFVGPRPALYNQDDLMALRKKSHVDKLVPGITGWAQINGRDDISIEEKVKLETYYLNNRSLRLDIKILAWTVTGAVAGKNVSH